MIENEIFVEKRKNYLNNEISYEDFYCWLGEFIGVTFSDIPFTIENLQKSKDSRFNDLPLNVWDAKHPYLLKLAKAKNINSWSYSQTVCVLKCLARKLLAQNNE